MAFFDTQPSGSNNSELRFDGAWSNYPYFGRDLVAISDMSNGLYILRTNLDN